jgi:methyl-accepting chemotaxis protein
MAGGGQTPGEPRPRARFELFRGSLAGRFSLMFLALLIPIAVVGLVIARGLTSNADPLLDALRVKELASRSFALLLAQDDVTKEILLDVERVSEAERKIAAYDENREVLREIATLTDSPELTAILAEMERLDDEVLRPADSLVLETLLAEGPAAAHRIYFERYEPVRKAYQEHALRLTAEAQALAERAEVDLAHRNRRSVANVAIGLLAGVATVALIMLLITRDVRARLARVVDVLESVARGDLRERSLADGRGSGDEIWRIGWAVDQAAAAMRSALSRATESANQVEVRSVQISRATETVAAAAAAQGREINNASHGMERVLSQVWGIAESARDLRITVSESSKTVTEVGKLGEEFHEGAESLTRRIEETSSAMDAMSGGVARVAASAGILARAATETTSRMTAMASAMQGVDAVATESTRLWQSMVERGEQGLSKVRETVQGIEEIRELAGAAELAVGALGARAVEIGAVLDVINSVADQTSLLALNASIIAAQSGESGRAFSVVADEIRNLAERVTTHTQEIETLVRKVQSESKSAIAAMKRGTQSVAGVVAISGAAGDVVEEITRSSRTSAARLAEVAEAVRAQARVSREVVELMGRTEAAVSEIHAAVGDQGCGTERAREAAAIMHEVAARICASTADQIAAIERIGASFEGIRAASEAVETALSEQSRSTEEVAHALDKIGSRCSENTRSAELTSAASDELRALAETLRRHVQRFSL